VNGSSVGSFSSTNLLSPNWPFSIGGQGEGVDDGYFNGSIDDLRVYDRALSPQEVKNLSTVPLPGTFILFGPALVGILGLKRAFFGMGRRST
jgi:hypothetical protein